MHLAAAAGDGHPALLVGQRRGVEQLGDALPALGLDQQHRAAVGGQGEGERGGDGGLAGPALAGDDVQARGGRVAADCAVLTRTSLGGSAADGCASVAPMTEPARRKWEYATIPLLIHNTKAILDSWGVDGWELVTVLPGPGGSDQLVAYLKRPA